MPRCCSRTRRIGQVTVNEPAVASDEWMDASWCDGVDDCGPEHCKAEDGCAYELELRMNPSMSGFGSAYIGERTTPSATAPIQVRVLATTWPRAEC